MVTIVYCTFSKDGVMDEIITFSEDDVMDEIIW